MSIGGAEVLILGVVVVLLFGPALAVAWLAWTIAKSTSVSDREPPRESVEEATDPAVMVARERYARGEISKEELDEIRATLGY